MLSPILDIEQENKTGVRLTKNVIKIPRDSRVEDMAEVQQQTLKEAWTRDINIYNLLQVICNLITVLLVMMRFQMGRKMSLAFSYLCEREFTSTV